MTTERDLIKRLTKRLEHLQFYTPVYDLPSQSALIDEAHAFLSQPEPEWPTDEELWELYDQRSGEPEDWPWIRDYARAVLARWGK